MYYAITDITIKLYIQFHSLYYIIIIIIIITYLMSCI
jgi:hypothetical protein